MEGSSLRIKLKRQDALCMFYLDGESGNWFAVCCARGAMLALGRKIEKGEELIVELNLKEVKNLVNSCSNDLNYAQNQINGGVLTRKDRCLIVWHKIKSAIARITNVFGKRA